MPDRPPVKLVGLPDGIMNGLAPVHDRAVEEIAAGKIPHGYLLLEYQGEDVTRTLTTGVETLKLRIIAVEEVTDDQSAASELADARVERTGEDTLPEDED